MMLFSQNKFASSIAVSVCLLFLTGIAGCDFNRTEAEYIEKAKSHIEKRERNAAIIEIKNALKLNANNQAARILLAQVYINQGDFINAEKEIRKAVELGADSQITYSLYAKVLSFQNRMQDLIDEIKIDDGMSSDLKTELYYYRGKAQLIGLKNIELATKEISASQKIDSGLPYSILGQALLKYAENNIDESRKLILAAQNAGLQNSIEAKLLLTDLAILQNKLGEAESHIGEVVETQPLNLSARIIYAMTLVNQDKLDAADVQLDKILTVLSRLPVANYLKAKVAYKRKDYTAAKTYAETTLSNSPDYLLARLLAGAANYGVENYEQANEHLQTFVTTVPGHVAATQLLAATQLKLGFTDKAAETLGDIKPEDLDDAKLIEAIAVASVKSGNLATGKTLLEKASSMEPDNAKAKARLGIAKINAGDIDAGIRDLEQAVRLDPALQEAELILVLTHLRNKSYDTALELASGLQAKYPESPHGYTLAGLAQIALGRKSQGVGLLEKAIQVSPGDISANSNLAAVASGNGDTNKARQYLANALSANEGNLQLLLKLSQLEFNDNKPDSGISYLEKAIAANPNSPQPRVILGRYYLGKQQPAKVLDVMSKIIDQIETAEIFELIGRAQMQLARNTDAVVTFKKLVNIAPKAASSHWNLARAYIARKNYASAEASLSTALQIDPKHAPSLYERVKVYLSTKKIKNAKDSLALLKKDIKNNSYIDELDAILAYIENDYQRSVEFFKKALSARENNILTMRLATALEKAGDSDAASDTLINWLKKYPEDLVTRKTYADYLLGKSKFSKAEKEYLFILNKEGEKTSPAIYNNLAWINLKLKSYDKALDFISQASVRAPENPFIKDTYATILLEQKNYKQALDLLREASRLAPKNREIQYHLAQSLIGLGKKEEAKQILKSIISQSSQGDDVTEVKTLLKTIN